MLRLHRIVAFVVLMGVISILPLSAIAQDGGGYRYDAPAYAVRGPHAVGTFDFVIDAGLDRPLNATVWYPALNPDGVEEAVTYDLGLGEVAPAINVWYGRAILDAAPDLSGGPYPFVLFSPGSNGSRFFGSFMCEHLASQGFVVIGVEHTGNTLADGAANGWIAVNQAASMVQRPQDVTRVIDYAETMTTQSEFQGLIDVEKVAILGWSFGGFTGFLSAGARLNMDEYAAWCADHPTDVDCPTIVGQEGEMARLAGLDAVPEGLWPSMADARVDAIIPIVPLWTTALGPDGLQGVTVPTLILASGADQMVDPAEFVTTYNNLSVPKTMVWLENASHFIFGGLCPEVWMQVGPAWCFDTVWDLDRAHDLMNHFITAFLLAKLSADADAAANLTPSAVDFVGITYQTTDFAE